MSKMDIPIWAKKDQLVWVEVRDQTDEEVLEYSEAVISYADFDEKVVKVKYIGQGDAENEVRADRIHKRLDEHSIIDDLSDIPVLNDAELLKHLEVRYNNNLIHCFCGPTLIVINPYKKIEHEESHDKYNLIFKGLQDNQVSSLIPHLWTISARCYDNLFKSGKNQAICISGESGAGKTESTKRCMAFITGLNADRRSIGEVPIEDKILSCNPLLEAFGNSKTQRNDNSSRFGKYTVLYLDQKSKKVKGASIENYLLEKSRVVIQSTHERNYHIFYALCRFADKEKLKSLHLLEDGDKCDMSKFNYLKSSGIYEHPKIDDQEFYEDVCFSLDKLGFSDKEKLTIWKLLAIILHLGNVKVDDSKYEEGKTPCNIDKNNHWKYAVELLGINESIFEEALTHKEIKVGMSVTKSPLTPGKCQNSIDSIAKDIYNRMFNWIVLKLNKTLVPQQNISNFKTIGILDIFGFEIFEKNSLEQFFINYANERLQSLYIDYIFKNECKIFEQEGLGEYTALIVYQDNKYICNAVDSTTMPPGILILIDQACKLNKKDEYLHAEVKKAQKSSAAIVFPRFATALTFIVKHTARDVEYLTDSFVEKNKDELSPFLNEAIHTSDETVVAIFDQISGLDINGVEEKSVNPNEKFLGYKFRRDMDNLINQLEVCECHFIRCIKPNEFKKSDFWNPHLALTQIRYMGLLDSLKVRKQSYPNRFTYSEFFEFYQDLHMGESGAKNFRILQSEGVNFKALSKELFSYIERQPLDKDVLYGQSKIFLQEEYYNYLNKILMIKQKKKKEAFATITALYKRYQKSSRMKEFFQGQSRSIMLSRDLLKSWTAKLDGLKFKNYLKIVRTIQFKFRYNKEKRVQRYRAHKMQTILKYLKMYKFSQNIQYILYYKRRVQVMQAMLDKKIRDAKNRYCRRIVENLFSDAWNKISKEIINYSAQDVQRTFRSYLSRKQRQKQFEVYQKNIKEQQSFTTSATIQKHIRGFIVRHRLEKLHRAASKIQGYFRMVWMRKYFKKLQLAVRVLQRWFKKLYVKHVQVQERMGEFNKVYGNYTQNVAQLEYNILFGDQTELANLENMNDYTKLPFYLENKEIDFGIQNYKKFLPKVPEIELKPKVKLITLLVDINVQGDTTNTYFNTWSKDFTDFLQKIHKKGNRLLHIELGETFTMAITEDKEVYSWGLNDFQQCAKQNNQYTMQTSLVKNLSVNPAKFMSLGKDHGLMVDEGDNVYLWGKNSEGQLGLDHTKQTGSIVIQNKIKGKIVSAMAKDNKSYVVTESGDVYEWPCYNQGENILKPTLMSVPYNIHITNVSAGCDFAIFQASHGMLYAHGSNKNGELGLGDTEDREELTLIEFFKDQNTKVIEVSCGQKHTICRTSLNKIYVWGSNSSYQLGTGDNRKRIQPEKLKIPVYKNFRYKARSVQAGLTSCFILLDDRNIFYTGKCGLNGQKINSQPIQFNYDAKVIQKVF